MTSARIPVLTLRRDLARQIRQGHPWLYRDALDLAPARALPTGAVVDVAGKDGKWLARGLYDAASPLAVRLYSDDKRPLDAGFLRERLRRAHELRERFIDRATTDGYRWCNGEGDLLPGVVIDRYAHVAVLRLDGDAVAALRPAIVEAVAALATELGITALIERSRKAAHAHLWGAELGNGEITIREHGVGFVVDVLHGQKTGLFLDQRESRALVRTIARGARVANLFSYTGGFSLYAAAGGATRVDSVDVAAPAIAAARQNFAHNGWSPDAHGFYAEDVFDWLTTHKHERYDVMIVDPPSFAPSEKVKDAAIAAYRDVFARSLQLVEPRGLFCPSSCSSHITTEDFLDAVQGAAQQARRRLQLVELRGQPADHPTPLPFTEGRYLKFAVLRSV